MAGVSYDTYYDGDISILIGENIPDIIMFKFESQTDALYSFVLLQGTFWDAAVESLPRNLHISNVKVASPYVTMTVHVAISLENLSYKLIYF